jgi:hypothetical protein
VNSNDSTDWVLFSDRHPDIGQQITVEWSQPYEGECDVTWTGLIDWSSDCVPVKWRPMTVAVSLEALQEKINRAYPNREAIAKLMEQHYLPAIEAEGFSKEQAQLISSKAYERGHSGGQIEQLCVTFDICEFAKQLLAVTPWSKKA